MLRPCVNFLPGLSVASRSIRSAFDMDSDKYHFVHSPYGSKCHFAEEWAKCANFMHPYDANATYDCKAMGLNTLRILLALTGILAR